MCCRFGWLKSRLRWKLSDKKSKPSRRNTKSWKSKWTVSRALRSERRPKSASKELSARSLYKSSAHHSSSKPLQRLINFSLFASPLTRSWTWFRRTATFSSSWWMRCQTQNRESLLDSIRELTEEVGNHTVARFIAESLRMANNFR